jgi:signal transduction histidine kinase
MSDARVLNVDDNAAQRYAVSRMLRDAGFEVLEASSGEHALSMLGERPALVLLDVHMPGLSGYEVCRRIKEDPRNEGVLVVQISAIYTTPDERLRGLEGGADGYLTQPYEGRELIALIRTLLRLRGDQSERLAIIRGEQEARALAESARDRIEFLARASEVLASTLEFDDTLHQVANLTVPRLADWCIVDLVDDAGRVQRAQVVHSRPMASDLLRRVRDAVPRMDDGVGPGWVMRRQQPVLGKDGFEAALSEELDRLLGVRSFVQAPMRLHGRAVGVITLMFTRSDRLYRDEDMGLVCDLASRAAAALQNARLYREARRAARIRDDLLAIVSHDMRTPLGVVAMQAQRLPRMSNEPAVTAAAAMIQRATDQMGRLIGDLLDLASIERGRLSIELRPVDAVPVIAEVAAMFEEPARARDVNLLVTPPAALAVLADRARLMQILTNLIDNAIKFTPAGGTVQVAVAADGGNSRFTVTDDGPGVAPDQVRHLFDPFWQARDDARGRGLGLYIARGLVTAHGGTISVDSRPGAGTRMSFTLPLAPEGGAPALAGDRRQN